MKIAAGIIGAAILSLGIGGMMGWMTWQHNAQGEVYDEHGIHWDFLLGISGAWAALAMGVCSILLIVWMILGARSGGRRDGPR